MTPSGPPPLWAARDDQAQEKAGAEDRQSQQRFESALGLDHSQGGHVDQLQGHGDADALQHADGWFPVSKETHTAGAARAACSRRMGTPRNMSISVARRKAGRCRTGSCCSLLEHRKENAGQVHRQKLRRLQRQGEGKEINPLDVGGLEFAQGEVISLAGDGEKEIGRQEDRPTAGQKLPGSPFKIGLDGGRRKDKGGSRRGGWPRPGGAGQTPGFVGRGENQAQRMVRPMTTTATAT